MGTPSRRPVKPSPDIKREREPDSPEIALGLGLGGEGPGENHARAGPPRHCTVNEPVAVFVA
jgi:hypothetical protein